MAMHLKARREEQYFGKAFGLVNLFGLSGALCLLSCFGLSGAVGLMSVFVGQAGAFGLLSWFGQWFFGLRGFLVS